MRLQVPPRGREPALLFVAREHLDRLRRTYLGGPADLVVEVTDWCGGSPPRSPGTASEPAPQPSSYSAAQVVALRERHPAPAGGCRSPLLRVDGVELRGGAGGASVLFSGRRRRGRSRRRRCRGRGRGGRGGGRWDGAGADVR